MYVKGCACAKAGAMLALEVGSKVSQLWLHLHPSALREPQAACTFDVTFMTYTRYVTGRTVSTPQILSQTYSTES
jgi:hypothetical protein